ncbi:Hypothetical predicted protein, partial [Cloeon dipterum]
MAMDRQANMCGFSIFPSFKYNKGGKISEKSNLLKSAWLDDVDTCRRLIEAGADVTTLTDRFGATALHYAARYLVHGKELVELFVSKGLCVDKRDKRGLLPLHDALRAKNLEAARELLQHRRDKRKHRNLMHFSVTENNLQFAQMVHKDDATLVREIGHRFTLLLVVGISQPPQSCSSS